MATRRTGKSFIWVTWLAKALAGQRCLYSPWFKVQYRYEKVEEMASDLAAWNRDHTAMMRQRRRELEEDGWSVTEEDANSFKLEGETAIVAGKPDLIATKDTRVLVVDGKTGRERDSDIWQVLLYLFALPKYRPSTRTLDLEGEVHYKTGDQRIALTPADLTPERQQQLVSMIKVLAASTPPAKVPSREECRFCNIGVEDCPERVREPRPVAVGEF